MNGLLLYSGIFPELSWSYIYSFCESLGSKMMMPYDDFVYLINSILLGEEPVCLFLIALIELLFSLSYHFFFQTIEDFILLVGTLVAFIAFVLWCCFPISPPKEGGPHFEDRYTQHYKKTDPSDSDWKSEKENLAAKSWCSSSFIDWLGFNRHQPVCGTEEMFATLSCYHLSCLFFIECSTQPWAGFFFLHNMSPDKFLLMNRRIANKHKEKWGWNLSYDLHSLSCVLYDDKCSSTNFSVSVYF